MKRIYLFLLLIISSIGLMAQNRSTETVYDPIDSTLLEEYTFEEERLIQSTHYVYKSMGDLALKIEYTYHKNGVVNTRTLESYRNNKITGRWQYTADDLMLFEESWKYDSKNRLRYRKQTFYDGAYIDKFIEKRKYRKDSYEVKAYLNKKLQYEYSDTISAS